MEEREMNLETPGEEDIIARAEAEFAETSDQLKREAEEFKKKYPEVDLWELEQDRRFRRFCGSRLYHENVIELYEAYRDFTEETREEARTRENARRSRGTGSGSGRSRSGLTPDQEAELTEWNRSYPHMRMTAEEFKKR